MFLICLQAFLKLLFSPKSNNPEFSPCLDAVFERMSTRRGREILINLGVFPEFFYYSAEIALTRIRTQEFPSIISEVCMNAFMSLYDPDNLFIDSSYWTGFLMKGVVMSSRIFS